MNARALAASLLLLGAACDQPWKPVHVIDSLRVIGVRAEPPEVRPGQTASLEALVLDPTRPGERTTMLWLGCEPDPYAQNRGACSDLTQVGDTQSIANAMQLPPGVKILGIGPRAAYSTQSTLFDVLDAGHPVRTKGTVGTILNIAVGADVPITASMEELRAVLDKVATKEIASQVTLFRVRVSEHPSPNVNPVIDDVFVEGEKLPKGGTLRFLPTLESELDLTAHDFQDFEDLSPTGEPQMKTESIIVAWYTTAGRFDYDRTSLKSDVKSSMAAPGDPTTNDPLPDDRRGRLWAVIRDTRGGQAWADWPWYVCDPVAPLPVVRSVERGSNTLTLRGDDLDQILEVVSENAVVRGAYSPSSRSWVGDAAPGALEVRARNCLTVRVP